MILQPGNVLAHYRLVEKIGEGGMGVVWKALDTKLNRHVALKILPPELTADDERRLRFQREAQAAAALSHSNIAVIFEVGEHEGSPFIAMELLRGKSLRSLAGRRPMGPSEWLRLAIPVAEGLSHAHRNGVVHRDLKPDNVMITDEGQVKILDFGLAKLVHPESREAVPDAELESRLQTISRELTRAGKVFGTVAYMSPEQARGEGVDHRSDLFSLGVMLYELASGRLPFKGKSDVETLSAVIVSEPPALSDVAGEMPSEAERIVRKMLEKDPASRFQHADELATDLRNLKRDLESGRASMPGGAVSGVASRQATAPAAGRRLPAWALPAGGLLAVVVAVLGYLQLGGGAGRDAGTDVTGKPGPGPAAAPEARRAMIAVLPFQNLGDAGDEYFASGVTEEIIGRLAAVEEVGVISRASAFQYDRGGKSTRQIGEDLGVDYVLDGTVRWARSGDGASRVRIMPQLVRVSDDTSLWSEPYDRTMEDIFAVQSEIAREVMAKLGVQLRATDGAISPESPTGSTEAYQAYLRGLETLRGAGFDPKDRALAADLFQRAVDEDPDFVQAQAALARAHCLMVHFGDADATGHRERARQAAERAVDLAPGSSEAHAAKAWYHYQCLAEFGPALREFEVALKGRPDDAELLTGMVYILRRQGQMEEALRSIRRAEELDPIDASRKFDKGLILWMMRRYEEADAALQRAITQAPDQVIWYAIRYYFNLSWHGSLPRAREIIDGIPPSLRTHPWAATLRSTADYFEGHNESAMREIADVPDDTNLFDGIVGLQRARIHLAAGEASKAREAWDRARVILEEKIEADPEDYSSLSHLGLALAGLGRKEEAIRAGRRAVELCPPSRDALDGPPAMVDLARIYVMTGEQDAALETLEKILALPATGISINVIRTDPVFRPLLDAPRLRDLERRHGRPPA